MTQPLLQVEDLRVSYRTPHGTVQAVGGVSLTVPAGGSVGIVGESGAGKSQLSLAVLGLLPRHARASGRVIFDGESLLDAKPSRLRALRGRHMAMVFQDPMSALNPYRRIGTLLVETLRAHGIARGRAALRTEAARLLDAVRIPQAQKRLGQYPHELSGGMRQRVMIALALSCRPRLLFADEPTTALDVTVQAGILRLLDSLREELGLALVLVSHDLGIIARHCEDTAVLYAGRVVERAPTQALVHAPRHPYTQGLLAARPLLDGDPDRALAAIPGAPPNPAHLPPGCAFAPRCSYATARCETLPELTPDASGARAWACHHPLGGAV